MGEGIILPVLGGRQNIIYTLFIKDFKKETFTYSWIATIPRKNVAKVTDENALHHSSKGKKQVKGPLVGQHIKAVLEPLSCPWIKAHFVFLKADPGLHRFPTTAFKGCSKTNQLDVIDGFWDIDSGSLEGKEDNATWKVLLPFSLPSLPLALFSLSSLLSCFCGLSPILSNSEK